MAELALLTEDEIEQWLAAHPAWSRDGLMIRRSLTFANFSEAFAFMTRAALMAEKLNHHPEWSNVYSKVELALTTHDVGGLSDLDLTFAETVDAIAPPG